MYHLSMNHRCIPKRNPRHPHLALRFKRLTWIDLHGASRRGTTRNHQYNWRKHKKSRDYDKIRCDDSKQNVNCVNICKKRTTPDSWFWLIMRCDIMSIPKGIFFINAVSLQSNQSEAPQSLAPKKAPPWAVASTYQTQWSQKKHAAMLT